MIKRYYFLIKKYFMLKSDSKELLIKLFITAILRSVSLLIIPYIASKIVDCATVKDYVTAVDYTLLFLLCSLIYVLFHHFNYVCYKNHAIYTHNKLQKLIFNKLTSYDENFTKNISVPSIISSSFNDIGSVQQIPDILFDSISELINIIISLFILIKVNFYIGFGIVVLNILTLYSLSNNTKKRDYYLRYQRKHQDSISNLLGQVLEGSKEIKTLNLNDDIENILEHDKKLWKKAYFKKRIYDDSIYVLVPMILGIGKILICFIMIELILKGEYRIATLILVFGYYDNIESQMEKLNNSLNKLSESSICVDRIHNVLNYKTKNMMDFGTNDNDYIKGKISFKNVSFNYENQEIIKNVSFDIRPHSFIAIVGKSGSGKSTIFRLLLRLYRANKGEILLDDESIYKYSKEVYSSNVSIVTQKPFIFDMSIRENLSLVDSNKEHQIEACKRALVHDFIVSLKDGYNTKLVSDAENISTGQKQLIALARTLLSKSEVLLFDEVTSALDVNTSKQIINILKDLKKDHTIIMITHKPQLMKMADEIIVIDHGRLVGKGTHKELIENNKYYQILQK